MQVALKPGKTVGKQGIKIEAEAVRGKMCKTTPVEWDGMLPQVRVELLG